MKDWTKTADSKYQTIWDDEKTDERTILRGHADNWEVFVFGAGTMLIEAKNRKKFNNKRDAKKYALDYMRKN